MRRAELQTNRERAIDVRAPPGWLDPLPAGCRSWSSCSWPWPWPWAGLLLVIAGVIHICRAQRSPASHMATAMAPAALLALCNIFHSTPLPVPLRCTHPLDCLLRTQLPHAGPRRAVSVRPTNRQRSLPVSSSLCKTASQPAMRPHRCCYCWASDTDTF